MQQENDYIKREIQKLTLVLMKLIDKTSSADANNFEAVVFETNEKLEEFKRSFNFETKELSNKLLLMIDFIDDNSKSFSVERMKMKSQLIKNINSN
ncbi:hypothetical protein [Aequorivita marina]|uniref:hypothetical protein n=1 Tax=Aequorivita marina TaxID=3073654 RepID=UPI0028766A92|nr:hypothetical protein [Aequorivita sp. S2608]MDS1298929.1 hypothetical protein [Aequorivita sp. S2608]